MKCVKIYNAKNGLSEHFKLPDDSSSKLYNFKIRYFDNTEELYKDSGLLHDE